MANKTKNLGAVAADDDWQVDDDLRTLMRAEEIEKDPKRMAAVRAMAKKKLLDLAAVASEKD